MLLAIFLCPTIKTIIILLRGKETPFQPYPIREAHSAGWLSEKRDLLRDFERSPNFPVRFWSEIVVRFLA